MDRKIFNRDKQWLMLLFFSVLILPCCLAQDFYLLAGTYTGTGSKGIYVYRFNAATGKAAWVSNTDSIVNPSFLAVHGDYLYAVNETSRAKPGKVSSFFFDKKSGSLHFLNAQYTGGDNPCHLAVSADGKWLTVANYSGGNLSVFPINKDGSLNPYAQLIRHTGKSINEKRQKQAYVHQTVFSPDNGYLFTPDLGLDQVLVYKFNPEAENPLSPASPPYIAVAPGSGPRHLVFSPNKKFAYLINELSGMAMAYSYADGVFSKIQELPAHPQGFTGVIDAAEIDVSPDGKFLYTSLRGKGNLVSVFRINAHTGKLKLKEHQPALGKAPRNFTIDPTGNYLLVANQDSDNIVIFHRNKRSGLLKATGDEIKMPKPVCLLMTPVQ